MDTQHRLRIAHKGAGAGSEVHKGAVMLFCVAVVAVCFAAPLLLTLPKTLDAAERPAPTPVEPASEHAPEAPYHERYPVQGTSDWTDTLEETELAAWRLRSSD